VICGVDIKGQAAWLAWYGSQLCVRIIRSLFLPDHGIVA